MAASIIPYGRLADGKFGVLLDNTTGKSIAAVMEVLATLPAVASADNFDGRLIFDKSQVTAFVFSSLPTPKWIALEGVPAEVGAVNGVPPSVPIPQTGGLFYDTDTKVIFVWDGAVWNPVGGLFAAQIIQQRYVGDNVTQNFATGAISAVPPQYVEVYLDGVRQIPNPGGDFSVVGTNVSFNAAVPTGVIILIRTTVSTVIAQSAQAFTATYVALGGQSQFSTGVASSDPAGVFVFVNGQIKSLSIDYQLIQQDTRIATLAKTSATNARATTTVAHNLGINSPVTIGGTSQSQYNASFTVSAVPSSTQFDFTVSPAFPASAVGAPVMFFTPAQINDIIQFNTPLALNDKVEIRTLKRIVVAPSQGEANTLQSIGPGQSLVGPKVGTVLQTKSIVAGPNVSVSSDASSITIGVTSGDSFTDRVGINASFYVVNGPESYVGVRNTSFAVTIDLSGVPLGASRSGRKITISDESGGAQVNNITVTTGGPFINGNTNYVINSNYGRVTLVFDGSNWFIIAKNV